MNCICFTEICKFVYIDKRYYTVGLFTAENPIILPNKMTTKIPPIYQAKFLQIPQINFKNRNKTQFILPCRLPII